MSADSTSTNPIVQAIMSGTAPPQARLAAARGLLPLPQNELIEVLVALSLGDDEEVAQAAQTTISEQETETLRSIASSPETSVAVLGYLAKRTTAGRAVEEAVVLNPRTSDEAIVALASTSADAAVLELITINQQRMIRAPAIMEAVLSNPARTPESERRVRETQREFFEKERGAQQVAEEMRARGMSAAAEFIEASESIGAGAGSALTVEDAWLIAEHIEVSDADIDDSWLPLERYEELIDETFEQRTANAERIINETLLEAGGEIAPERISLIRRVMLMSVKDRVKLGMKGDREARAILIRDSNRVVSSAVIHNPRITDQEVEGIASMRTVSDEVLRLIAMNRAWARSYPITHNLARNPRTPIPTAISILPRLYAKDLKNISQSRNVSETVRRQAARIALTRTGK
jgi:hypothetical protein